MATLFTVSILPLKEGQKISEWEPKFRASVVSAYVKLSRLEERVVLEAILKDTLDKPCQTLKEYLYPAIDQFDAANTFRQLLWPVSESVHEFAARYLEKDSRQARMQDKVAFL